MNKFYSQVSFFTQKKLYYKNSGHAEVSRGAAATFYSINVGQENTANKRTHQNMPPPLPVKC